MVTVIEFWINLTEIEISREKHGRLINNYIRNYSSELISLMLANIIKVTIEDDD